MVTTFSLEPGYSGYMENITPEMIQEISKTITIEQLKNKCTGYGLDISKFDEDGIQIKEYIEIYRNIPTDDLSCRFYENGVIQSASGGGESRKIKEIIRCAFGILVLDACYKKHLSVSFRIS